MALLDTICMKQVYVGATSVPSFAQNRQLMTTVRKEIIPINKLRMSLCRYLQNSQSLHKIL